MSIWFKAKGTPSIGLFLIRLTLGTYTLTLGIMQAGNIQKYIDKVQALGIMSDNMSFIIGFILPFLLIIFGALYVMGFFTPVTSSVLAFISFLKIIARGFFPTDGIPFNKDIIFFICFLATLFGGAGILSFDILLDRKKKKTKEEQKPKVTVTAEVITQNTEEPPVQENPQTPQT